MPTAIDPDLTALNLPPLRLRPWREEDAPAVRDALHESMQSVSRFLAWCHPDYDLEEARTWIARCRASWLEGTMYDFAILAADGELLGAVGLNDLDAANHRANLGYWIRDSARGNSYTALAARAVAAFGFERLELERIEIVAAIDNLASQRCAEKIGGVVEGVARRRIWIREQPHDAVVYGLLPEDLAQQAAAHQSAISS
jgi:RimJ/RimL family protein N-acetyltransferase